MLCLKLAHACECQRLRQEAIDHYVFEWLRGSVRLGMLAGEHLQRLSRKGTSSLHCTLVRSGFVLEILLFPWWPVHQFAARARSLHVR